jgi:hypothetical protein
LTKYQAVTDESVLSRKVLFDLSPRGGKTRRREIDTTMIVEPKPSSWEAFSESTVTADGILTLKADHSELSSKLHANERKHLFGRRLSLSRGRLAKRERWPAWYS